MNGFGNGTASQLAEKVGLAFQVQGAQRFTAAVSTLFLAIFGFSRLRMRYSLRDDLHFTPTASVVPSSSLKPAAIQRLRSANGSRDWFFSRPFSRALTCGL